MKTFGILLKHLNNYVVKLCGIGSPRVEGDDDEEDVDDIEHEFNIEEGHDKHAQIVEAMLHGKMSYGRGPEDEDASQFPPVIAGTRSRPVNYNELENSR